MLSVALPTCVYLGLQLEPGGGQGGRGGLQVAMAWRDLPKGSIIVDVDGVCLADLDFNDGVALLRKSKTRLVRCVLPSLGGAQGGSMLSDSENINPQSPAGVGSRRCGTSPLRSPKSRGGGLKNSGGAKSPVPPTARAQAADLVSSLGAEIEKTKALYLSSVAQVDSLTKELEGKVHEVAALKSQTRGLDGQIVLLKYQLGKQKRSDKKTAPSTIAAKESNINSLSAPDVQSWILHWRKSQQHLAQLVQRVGGDTESCKLPAEAAPANPPDDLVRKLQTKLAVQEKFAQRLQLQIHNMVDLEINKNRCAAEQSAVKCTSYSSSSSSSVTAKDEEQHSTPFLRTDQKQHEMKSSTTPKMLKQLFDGMAGSHEVSVAAVQQRVVAVEQAEEVFVAMTPRSMRVQDQPAPHNNCPSSSEIYSAWKAWGAKRYTEVAYSGTIHPLKVVFSPASTSPATFREQMSRLRGEHKKIKQDIADFRSKMKVRSRA